MNEPADTRPSTTGAGAPAPSDRDSLTIGPDGPILLHDVHFLEQMAHFNREKVPERQPHAKGSGAFGTFETTEDVSAWTKASVFQQGGSAEGQKHELDRIVEGGDPPALQGEGRIAKGGKAGQQYSENRIAIADRLARQADEQHGAGHCQQQRREKGTARFFLQEKCRQQSDQEGSAAKGDQGCHRHTSLSHRGEVEDLVKTDGQRQREDRQAMLPLYPQQLGAIPHPAEEEEGRQTEEEAIEGD